MTGLYLAGAFSCANSNLLKDYDLGKIYRDYLIVQTAKESKILNKAQFDSLLATFDKDKIQKIKFKLSDEAVKKIIRGN